VLHAYSRLGSNGSGHTARMFSPARLLLTCVSD